MIRRAQRMTTAIAAIAITGATLATAAPSASATAAFTNLTFSQTAATGHWPDSACDRISNTTAVPADASLPENGRLTRAATTTQQWISHTDDTESATVTAESTSTATASSRSGLPDKLTLTYSGSASIKVNRPEFACSMNPSSGARTEFSFAITRPLLVTLSYKATRSTYTDMYIGSVDDYDQYVDLYGRKLNGSGATSTYLPAGRYEGYLEGDVVMSGTKSSGAVSGSGTAQISFAVPGTATAPATGTATRLVTFPAGRNCAAHNIAPALTTNAKRLKPLRRVAFALNGLTATTFKGTGVTRGRAATIRVADDQPARLTVTATRKKGGILSASIGYRPCS